jgi:hypothetical protein
MRHDRDLTTRLSFLLFPATTPSSSFCELHRSFRIDYPPIHQLAFWFGRRNGMIPKNNGGAGFGIEWWIALVTPYSIAKIASENDERK